MSRTPSALPPRNPNLHGYAPDRCDTALILVDVINAFDFPQGKKFAVRAWPTARHIARLKGRLKRKGVPAIYVNDNFGKWRSDFRELVRHCSEDGMPGARITSLLSPDEEDYFVLKPKHSAFYSTALETLLRYLGARKLILAGFTSHLCILFTAKDAYVRDYHLKIPRDCIQAPSPKDQKHALFFLKDVLKADISPSGK